MNCRDFLAEFEERQNALSQPARLHLNDCPDCKKTSGEQTRVWQMIDGLARVDAPNDFDFRVKAKIANRKPADFQPQFLPALRYVLPLSLVVLVLGLAFYNTAYFSSDNAASPIVATASPQLQDFAENPAGNSSLPEQLAATNNSSQFFTDEETVTNVSRQRVKPAKEFQETQFIAIKSKRNPAVESRRRNAKDNSAGAGSNERALTSTKVFVEENLNPNKTVENLSNGGNQNLMDGKIWELIGVETVSDKQSLEVKAVKQNSLAARSGIKVGDVIESIDGVKLSAEPLRMKQIEVKKLTVVRGAAKIEITLKN